MAWSDAARRAALEVRRAHAAARKSSKKLYVSAGLGDPIPRDAIARDLRRIRKGLSPLTWSRSKVATMAVASTQLRNANRYGLNPFGDRASFVAALRRQVLKR